MNTTPTFSLVLSTSVSAADLRRWHGDAAPGDKVIYASGFDLPRGAEGVLLARQLSDSGQARLHQRRDPADARRWQWEIVKVGGPARAGARSAVLASATSCCAEHPAATREQAALLALLVELPVVDGRMTCPSNAELARELGLGAGADARRRARYLLEKLRAAGRIEVEHTGRDSARLVRVIS